MISGKSPNKFVQVVIAAQLISPLAVMGTDHFGSSVKNRM